MMVLLQQWLLSADCCCGKAVLHDFIHRAERPGSGDGRVHIVSITATYGSGNHTTADVEIIVPYDEGNK
ncbi:MAG: hypothetical protein SWH78_18125 [Thermodesulfobacteriota bacterium]|nr:hypothetical protein [Thermodesulfobacteriota bacterium]